MSGRAPSAWRDPVPALAGGGPRPRWSVMIPSYRCAHYLAETLSGVLAQDQGPQRMQIEVIDDASDDDPEAVVRDVGSGRVSFHRQPRNVGHVANFHCCLLRARGEIVHLLHGDDMVRPGFYRALERGFDAVPGLGAAFCRSVYVDAGGAEISAMPPEAAEPGLLPEAPERLALEQRIMTPSIAVRRAVYELLGGFDRRLACAEDWEMWVRIAAHYPIWYEPAPLAVYRMHRASNTGRHLNSAADSAYNRIAIGIFSAYLPADRAAEIARRARRTYAASALDTASALFGAGEAGGFAQLREALRLSPSAGMLWRAMRIALDLGRRRALDS